MLLAAIIFVAVITVTATASIPAIAGPTYEGPAPGPNLQNFGVNAEIAEEAGTGDKIIGGGSVLYNITVGADVPFGQVPREYPVNLTYTKDGQKVGGTTLRLTPTDSLQSFVSDGSDSDSLPDRRVVKRVQVRFTVTENPADQHSFGFTANDSLSQNSNEDSVTRTESGFGQTNPGENSNTRLLLDTDISGVEPRIKFASRYRINEPGDTPGALESNDIPIQSPRGEMRNFSNMRKATGERATVAAEQEGLTLGTKTKSIPSVQPYTILVGYSLDPGNNVTLDVLDERGEEINVDTEYTLYPDADDDPRCRSQGSSTYNVCMFTLHPSEGESIRDINELYLKYQSGSGARLRLYCQATVAGYLQNNEQTCGLSDINDYTDAFVTDLEGNTSSSNGWQESPLVQNEPQLDFRGTFGTTGPDSLDLDWKLYEESQIRSDRTIGPEESSIRNGTLDSFSQDNVTIRLGTDVPLAGGGGTELYRLILCRNSSSTCNMLDNVDTESMTVDVGDAVSPPPNIVTESPILVRRGFGGSETYESAIRVKELVNRPTGGGWVSADNNVDGFTGKQSEVVTVEDVRLNNGRDASDYEGDARAKLSRAPDGPWSLVRTQVAESEKRVDYGNARLHEGEQDWEKSTLPVDRRNIPGEYETREFKTFDSTQLKNIVRGGAGWFLDRQNETVNGEVRERIAPITNSTVARTEVQYQHADPDKCFNCFRTQTALDRDIDGFTPATQTPPNVRLWNKPSTGAVSEVVQVETDQELVYRQGSIASSALLYRTNPTQENLFRIQRFGDEYPIYRWVHKQQKNKVEFKKPQTERIFKWTNTSYDISYKFEAEIDQADIVTEWRKAVETTERQYQPEIHWFDLSQSFDDDQNLDNVEIQMSGANRAVRYDWVPGVHTKPNDDRQCRANTSSTTYEPEILTVSDSDLSGRGGDVKIHRCNIESESNPALNGTRVLRVGKAYDTNGAYNPVVRMTNTAGQTTTRVLTVEVMGEDAQASEAYQANTPQLDDITPVNKRVNYVSGKATFEINISSKESQTETIERLPGEYQIRVSPADRVSSAADCLDGFEKNSSRGNIGQTDTRKTFLLETLCESTTFDTENKPPDEFQIAAVLDPQTNVDGNLVISPTGEEFTPTEVPGSAVVTCSGYLEEASGSNDCINPRSNGSAISTSPSTPIPGRKFITDADENEMACPPGYRTKENSVFISDDQFADTSVQDRPGDVYKNEIRTDQYVTYEFTNITCNIQEPVEFTLTTQEETLFYTPVQRGVFEQCDGPDGIPGYVTATGTDPGVTKCQQADPDDPGPDETVIVSPTGNFADEQTPEPRPVAPGAIRSCPSGHTQTTVDRTIVCNDGDTRYSIANVEKGSPTRASPNTTFSNIDTSKTVWRDGEIPGGNETIIATVNPRRNGEITPTGDSETQTFTFVVESLAGDEELTRETVEVNLCKAEQGDTIPKTSTDGSPCEYFDSDLDGLYDYRVDTDEANTSTNIPVRNDVCPHTQQYPRKSHAVGSESSGVDLYDGTDGNNTTSQRNLRTMYSTQGDFCEPAQTDDFSLPLERLPNKESENGIVIDGSFWDNNTDFQKRIRHAGEEALNQNANKTRNIAQNAYDSGDNLRVGFPVTGQHQVNENLIAYYPFDTARGQSAERTNRFKIQDVYARGNDSETSIANGRIWNFDPCFERPASSSCPNEFQDTSQDFYTDSPIPRPISYLTYSGNGASVVESTPNRQLSYLFENPSASNIDTLRRLSGGDKYTPFAPTDASGSGDAGVFGSKALHLDESSYALFSDAPQLCGETSVHSSTGNNEYFSQDLTNRPTDYCQNGPGETFNGELDGPGMNNRVGDGKTLEDLIAGSSRDGEYTIAFWYKAPQLDKGDNYRLPNHKILNVMRPPDHFAQNVPLLTQGARSISHGATLSLDYMATAAKNPSEYPIDSCTNGRFNTGSQTDSGLDKDNFKHSVGFAKPIESDEIPSCSTQVMHDQVASGDAFNFKSEEPIADEWKHVAVTHEPGSTGQTKLYIDGTFQGKQSNRRIPQSQAGTETKDTVGSIGKDQVITLGARMQPYDDAFRDRADNQPYSVELPSEGKFDDLRVYNSTLENAIPVPASRARSAPSNLNLKVQRLADRTPTSIIKSDPIEIENLPSDRSSLPTKLSPQEPIRVSVEGKGSSLSTVKIIPCDTSPSTTVCAEQYAATANSATDTRGSRVTTVQFGTDTPKTANFDDELEEQLSRKSVGLNEINAVRIGVRIDQRSLASVSEISEIKLSLTGQKGADETAGAFKNCAQIQQQYPSVRSEEIKVDLNIRGENTRAHCNMDVAQGGWTRFAWATEGTNSTLNMDNTQNDSTLIGKESGLSISTRRRFGIPYAPSNNDPDPVLLNECSPDDDNCLSRAPITDSQDTELMIRAVNTDGTTESWAAYNLHPAMNWRNQQRKITLADRGINHYTNTLSLNCQPDNGEVCLNKVSDNLLGHLSDKQTGGDGNVNDCLYPMATSPTYEPRNNGCTDFVEDDTIGTTKSLELSSAGNNDIEVAADVTTGSPRDTLFIERKNLEPTQVDSVSRYDVETVRCLGADVQRCELYYRQEANDRVVTDDPQESGIDNIGFRNLNRTNAQPPKNKPPAFGSPAISLNTSPPVTGQETTINVTASDPDTSIDSIRYQIGTSGGQRTIQKGGDSVTHKWNTSNIYDITVTISDGVLTKQQTKTVNVIDNREPNSTSFSTRISPVIIDQPVTLQASATDPDGDSLQFLWNLSGGKNNGDTHTFTKPGLQSVDVIVTDGNGGRFTKTTIIDVNYPESCKQILQANSSATDGTYTINPAGNSFDVRCEMGKDGGGWTGINPETAERFISNVSGQSRFNVFHGSSGTTTGTDGVNPYSYDGGRSHGLRYRIPLGFSYTEMYADSLQVGSASYRDDNSDTSEVRRDEGNNMASNGWSDSYEGTGGDIGFGSKAEVAGSWANSDDYFESQGSDSESGDVFAGGGTIYQLTNSADTAVIGWGEGGGQVEGFEWEDGYIYVR